MTGAELLRLLRAEADRVAGIADLRARAERAEQQADAYRDGLARLRARISEHTAAGTARRARQAALP